jgi:hypothetical protein
MRGMKYSILNENECGWSKDKDVGFLKKKDVGSNIMYLWFVSHQNSGTFLE